MRKWKEQLNGDCPKRDAPQMHDRCDLICPDLPKGDLGRLCTCALEIKGVSPDPIG
jgi:hypothetical protein